MWSSFSRRLARWWEAIYRLNLEEDLRKSEENYRSIFENAIEGIFQIESDGRFLSLNPALVRMLGYESTEGIRGGFRRVAIHRP